MARRGRDPIAFQRRDVLRDNTRVPGDQFHHDAEPGERVNAPQVLDRPQPA